MYSPSLTYTTTETQGKLSSSGVRRQLEEKFLFVIIIIIFFKYLSSDRRQNFFWFFLCILLHLTIFFLSKGLVFPCFLVFRRLGEYISLELFYFVSLTSGCSLIP